MDISQRIDQLKAHIDEGGTYTQEVALEIINELQTQNERYRVALEHIANCNEGLYLYNGSSCNCAEYCKQALTGETK